MRITDRAADTLKNVPAELASMHGPESFRAVLAERGVDLAVPMAKPDADRLFDILNARFRSWTGQDLKGYARGPGPCVKQTVTATIVAVDGRRFTATNFCEAPQQSCPRSEMPTGVGYELCKSVCRQPGHAEVNAIRLAKAAAVGATLYLEGHTYACDNCKAAAEAAGIAEIVIGAPPL